MAKQGCPNEGSDNRTGGWLICFLQRRLSWFSQKPPKMREHGNWAYSLWPPYIVINSKDSDDHRWFQNRLGWRYDKNWVNPKTGEKGGYIGPGGAAKHEAQPLEWY